MVNSSILKSSLSELLDRLAIDQIKDFLLPGSDLSFAEEMDHIEDDLNLIFKKNSLGLNAGFIRLLVALAQINLHIWQTKEVMQNENESFQKNMKLGHQLNGLRNQIKNRLLKETGFNEKSALKSNVETDNLDGWFMSILATQGDSCAKKKETSPRKYKLTLVDLIDSVTINQIKEVFYSGNKRNVCTGELNFLSCDIDMLIRERQIKLTGQMVRIIMLLAQANLLVWYSKDRMKKEPQRYYALLEFAQELNGLRNYLRNILMIEFGEAKECNKRATFLDYNNQKWYSRILNKFKLPSELSCSAFNTLTLEDFSRVFCIPVEDMPLDCWNIINSMDFRYKKLNSLERDQAIRDILKRINSDNLWISGADKKNIWEKGWLENAREYQENQDVASLTPKYLKSKKILRLDCEYVKPFDDNFEFNVIDVYRHWVFKKYFKDVQSIYEFGCGSCQHLPVLAKLFPEKQLHGLDWAVASSKIIDKLVKDRGWNITSHVFDFNAPDDRLPLDGTCGVFTMGAMEQLGNKFEKLLQFLICKRPAVVVHMESIVELYDENCLTDYLAIQYDKKRNYLDGYLSRLKQLQRERIIEISNCQRISFGSMFHDSYSLLVWHCK